MTKRSTLIYFVYRCPTCEEILVRISALNHTGFVVSCYECGELVGIPRSGMVEAERLGPLVQTEVIDDEIR